MAQAGFTPIQSYYSITPAAAPSAGNLSSGELAINITDGKLFYKDNLGAVQVLAVKMPSSILPTANGGTGLGSYTQGDLIYSSATNVLAKLGIGASTTILTSSGTAPQWTTASSVAVGRATNLAGGAANQIPAQSGANTTTFIAAPTTASTYLSWTGSAFAWSNVTPGSTFAGDITVNTLTVGKGPNNPFGTTTFGFQAGLAASSSSLYQTAIGYRALASSTITAGTGFEYEGSTAVGYKALEASIPSPTSSNTAVGAGALKSSTLGGFNTAVGAGAGYNITGIGGTGVTIVGAFAGLNATTSGSFVAIGTYALNAATDRGGSSVAVGSNSLLKATTNSVDPTIFNRFNTAVGTSALRNLESQVSGLAGSENTSLGYLAGLNLISGSNNTIIGANAQASSTNVSNEITLGNSSITTLRCQVTSITSLSDERDKYSIEDLPVGLDLIKQLRPRRFKWDKRDWYFDEIDQEDGTVQHVAVPKDGTRAKDDWNEGFIAQEAKAALQAAGADWFPLVYESNPEKLEMSSGKLIPVLVKAIQELTARIEALEAK